MSLSRDVTANEKLVSLLSPLVAKAPCSFKIFLFSTETEVAMHQNVACLYNRISVGDRNRNASPYCKPYVMQTVLQSRSHLKGARAKLNIESDDVSVPISGPYDISADLSVCCRFCS